jgi:hypothetical protein
MVRHTSQECASYDQVVHHETKTAGEDKNDKVRLNVSRKECHIYKNVDLYKSVTSHSSKRMLTKYTAMAVKIQEILRGIPKKW